MDGVLAASALFLFLQTFILPNVPRIANGDQGIYLCLGARMLDGQLIYRDYDHFTPPGTDVLYLILFELFGVRAWIAPAMLILLGVSITWLSFKICETVMTGPIVFLPGFLFLTLPFSGYLDATHHWYSTLAGTAAVLCVIEKRTQLRLLWSGALWGVATCFTQSAALGALGTAGFLIWEAYRVREGGRSLLRKESLFIGGLLSTVVAFNAYFIWRAGLRRFFDDTVVFIVKYYAADTFNQWRAYMADPPSIHTYSQWPNVAAFALIHLITPSRLHPAFRSLLAHATSASAGAMGSLNPY